MGEPLNGTKTHPLTKAGVEALGALRAGPLPCSSINPGIVNRLTREALAEIVDLPSPFKTHRGGTCQHLRITAAGLARLP